MHKPIVIAVLLLLVGSNSWAKDITTAIPPGNWNKVQGLSQDANISIELRNGLEIDGEFVGLSEDSIILKDYGTERRYPQKAVVKIKLMRPGSRTRNAAIVGGAVFGAGFGIGYAGAASMMDKNSATAGERAQIGALMGSLWGGVAAAIAAAHRPGPRGELIYLAK